MLWSVRIISPLRAVYPDKLPSGGDRLAKRDYNPSVVIVPAL